MESHFEATRELNIYFKRGTHQIQIGSILAANEMHLKLPTIVCHLDRFVDPQFIKVVDSIQYHKRTHFVQYLNFIINKDNPVNQSILEVINLFRLLICLQDGDQSQNSRMMLITMHPPVCI